MEDQNKDNASKNRNTTTENTPTTTLMKPNTLGPYTRADQISETFDTTTRTTKEVTSAANDEKTCSSDSNTPTSELELPTDAKAALDAKDTDASLPQNTLTQIMKAHSEQTTTAARAGVETAAAVSCMDLRTATAFPRNTATSLNETNAATVESANSSGDKSDNVSVGTVVPNNDTVDTAVSAPATGDLDTDQPTPTASIRSIGSFVCRICHNAENPERLVSPCLCKGSLTYVHIHCLERWISTSRNTTCELCQFQYNTEQTLRYTCLQSLRMWYSRSMSRRALQEDCQMFSLLTLVAFGIIGTLLVGIQYYFLQGHSWGLGRLWTKGWMVFFLFTTLVVYFVNIYMIVRSQLAPWYRWWRSARDIKLILENRKPFHFRPSRRLQTPPITEATSSTSATSELQMPPTLQQQQHHQQQQQQQFQQQFQQQQQEHLSAAAQYLPTPSAAVIDNTTHVITSPTLRPTTLTLQLQLNKNAATVAAFAALDAVFYNKYAKNCSNNNKKCSTLLSMTAAVSNAAAGDANFTASEADAAATTAVEIPLDPVVYELASAI